MYHLCLRAQYIFNPETSEWRHRNLQVFKDRKWLGNLSYRSGKLEYVTPAHVHAQLNDEPPASLAV